MGTLVKPFTFTNRTVIDATEFNSNFDTLYTGVNGNLDTANIATSGVGTSEIADDAVNEAKIDWGTGANQVSLDDVPNGSTSKLGQDCSTAGNPTFAAPTVTTLNVDTTGKLTSGGIEFLGANVPGWCCNLGMSLSAGVFTVLDAQGVALSATNPGWVTVRSTTGGQLFQMKITTGFSVNDDSHASSNFTNLDWGITAANGWANDKPFFLYVANRNNTHADGSDGNSALFISPLPHLTSTPSSANDIGDTAAIPTNDNQRVILFMSSITEANYTSLPCQLIGAIRMRWNSGNADWTIQSLGGRDGFGIDNVRDFLKQEWTWPSDQMGATGQYMVANGGTIPSVSTQESTYVLDEYGTCTMQAYWDTDAGTDGAGAVSALFAVPYTIDAPSTDTLLGTAYVSNPTYSEPGICSTSGSNGSTFWIYRISGAGAVVQWAAFSNGTRQIRTRVQFRIRDV